MIRTWDLVRSCLETIRLKHLEPRIVSLDKAQSVYEKTARIVI